jgi:hypothetical protein
LTTERSLSHGKNNLCHATPSALHARRPADPDGNVDYTGPIAAEDDYERAKKAKQEVIAAQTALLETSLQAQIDVENAERAKQDALETSLQAQRDVESAKQAKQDALETSLQAERDFERARQAEQDAHTTFLQAQADMETIKKANGDMALAAEALRRQEEDINQKYQATELAAKKGQRALQAAIELGCQQPELTWETSYMAPLDLQRAKKRVKRKDTTDDDGEYGENFIGMVDGSIDHD